MIAREAEDQRITDKVARRLTGAQIINLKGRNKLNGAMVELDYWTRIIKSLSVDSTRPTPRSNSVSTIALLLTSARKIQILRIGQSLIEDDYARPNIMDLLDCHRSLGSGESPSVAHSVRELGVARDHSSCACASSSRLDVSLRAHRLGSLLSF